MAYNLCSPPSPFLHNRHSLSSPLPEPWFTGFPEPLRPCSLPSQFRTSIQISNVSSQAPLAQEDAIRANPDGKSSSSPKVSTWVNPRSKISPKLKKLPSSEPRYPSLALSESLNSCNPNEEDVVRVLKDFGRDISERGAVFILNNMSNPDTAVIALKYFQERLKPEREVVFYNVTLKVLKKNRNFCRAEKLFGEMLERGVKPDNVTFFTLVTSARNCSLPEKAVEWFEKMPSLGCDPNGKFCAVMIDAYGQTGNVDMALSLYYRARAGKWGIDVWTFVSLVKMYAMSGNFEGCLKVYKEMKVLGVKPNLSVYTTLFDAMGRAKWPWHARSIHSDMIDNGLLPDGGTYAALLHAYGRGRFCEDALKVYKEMKEKGFDLNVNLYNTLLASCAHLGFADEAIEVFREMKKSGTCSPDSWTFSSMITVYSSSGKVSEAEGILEEMLEAGLQPNILVLTSLMQCYGKVQLTEKVVKTFDQVLELGITPDDLLCGCLLNVMTQTPKEELGKLIVCVDKANPKLGQFVRLLMENHNGEWDFKKETSELLESLSSDVKRAYCNCLTDLCFNLNLMERASELQQLGIALEIYPNVQSRSPSLWSLHLKGLSQGAALIALRAWINDISKAVESGEELPPSLGIHTGHGKHRYSDQGLAAVCESHLEELKAPFYKAPFKVGWFFTSSIAAKSWLESKNSFNHSTAT